MRLDFYLSELNAPVEFDGRQHFGPVRWTKIFSVKRAKLDFVGVQRRDRLKSKWAEANGYTLRRLSNLSTVEDDIKQFIALLPVSLSDAV